MRLEGRKRREEREGGILGVLGHTASEQGGTGTTSHNSVERRQPVCQREHRRGPLEGVNEGHASQGETQRQRHIS